MNLDRVYIFFSDPGHGWLAVPMEVLKFLGIERAITPYSYISRSGKTAYLEEDVDAPLFKAVMENKLVRFRHVVRYCHNESSIRRLPGYPTVFPCPPSTT